ncbi:hypothetical protein Tco_1440452, partial [Tanacetum coccineum]
MNEHNVLTSARMLRRFTNVASKSSFIRTYSSASRQAFFEKFVVRDDDFKGTFTNSDFSTTDGNQIQTFLLNIQIEMCESDSDSKPLNKKTAHLCRTANYHKVVTAVDPTMKNENHSKVCGSGGSYRCWIGISLTPGVRRGIGETDHVLDRVMDIGSASGR